MLFVGRKGFLIPERYHFYCKKTWTDQVSYWDGMALNKPPWAFSATFLNAKWLGFQWSVDNLFCSFLLSQKTLAFLCHYLSFTSTTLSAPFTRLHILVSTTYLKVILPNSFYYLKDSIKRWYWTQKYQIKYCEIGNCRIQREGWSCYYLCQCLDWNLFSINYLEDLHKLLPS